jgi:imidazolonepropionase-like amidohydrolase
VRRVIAPDEDYRDDDSAAVARLLMERGVIVNTGAHGQREGLATHWEIWSFARGGMSPIQALATATINPATYLGMEDEIGSLEVGKLADLQVVDGDPLADLRVTDRLTHVMLNGRLYQASDLQEVITGDRSTAPSWWHGKKHYEIR